VSGRVPVLFERVARTPRSEQPLYDIRVSITARSQMPVDPKKLKDGLENFLGSKLRRKGFSLKRTGVSLDRIDVDRVRPVSKKFTAADWLAALT